MSAIAGRPAGVAGRAASVAVALALLALAGALMLAQEQFRDVEARVAAVLMAPIVHGDAAAAGSIVWFGLGSGHVNGFQITTLCSTVILITPLLAMVGVMLLVRPLALGRVLVGLAIGAGLVAACNLLRYSLAAIALQTWGDDGFELVHRYLGSLLVIAGFIAAFILLLRVATTTRRPQRGRHS
ncbi:exosortase S [Gryllotalpicola koreensis]|uniref:Exosortase/archaeosortase family protein n=1 Tax=Gryllotalpicola koreensis TaxID=993086 RepID=A0ABP8A010_9MICO